MLRVKMTKNLIKKINFINKKDKFKISNNEMKN